MAKRYDNDFDAEGFVENFRATEDAPAPSPKGDIAQKEQSPSSTPPKERTCSPRRGKDRPAEAVKDYKELYIDEMKYRSPRERWPQASIYPPFEAKIREIEARSGNRQSNLSTYINNVLEQHFRDWEAQINEI